MSRPNQQDALGGVEFRGLSQLSLFDSSSHGNIEAHTLADQECWKTARRSYFPPGIENIIWF